MTSSAKRRLILDCETFSSVDIGKSGAFRYMEAPDFEIMLIAYAWDKGPVQMIDLMTGEGKDSLPEILAALQDPDVVKIAHNSAFEREAFRKQFGMYQNPEEWEDTMILAAYNGLPLSLDAAGAALNLTNQKIKEGTLLINYFCKNCRPTISNKGRTRNYPEHAPDKWNRFKEYCVRDVEVCQSIYYRLNNYKATDFERKVWALDARINERGVMVDMELVRSAIAVDEAFRAEHLTELKQLTGLSNPNSVMQLKEWLVAYGVEIETLNKATVGDLLKTVTDPTVRRVLELRQLLGKTSTKKYESMLNAAGHDERIRGLFQYYGARTGRWAGRLCQLQNLPQNHLDNIGEVREIVRAKDLEMLELLFDSVPDTLSQLIRTALIAKPGHTFLVCDYSAIEARVIAWLAGERWRMDVFANGGDIYCASASKMFGVPVEKHGVNSHLRQKGKVAELGLGFAGGVGALKAFGAERLGLSEEEMQDIVTQWRLASPAVVKLWRDTGNAARNALENPGKTFTLPCGIKYHKDKDALRCKLLSGRVLSYWNARLEDGRIVFDGQNQVTRQWEKVETFQGKLVENSVQATARDCLAVAMVRLEEAGYHTVASIHDEVVVEAPADSRWEDVAEIMGRPIEWAQGLLLTAEGYSTPFYLKM